MSAPCLLQAAFDDSVDAHMLHKQIDGYYGLTFMEKARAAYRALMMKDKRARA